MFKRLFLILGTVFLLMASATQLRAAYMTVEIFSLTQTAYAFPNMLLTNCQLFTNYGYLPFYLQVNLQSNNNTNWGIELYTNNREVIGPVNSSDGLYRGLRARDNIEEKIPLYWQVYPYDQNVGMYWGAPNSVTTTVGGLAISAGTLRFWQTLYDSSDIDRSPTWNTDRPERTIASVNGLAPYPQPNRPLNTPAVYVYFGADMSTATNQEYIGQLTMDYFYYPFDFNTGCYVTPNPFRPIRGERAYFNFYTNYPDSRVIIKIYDPTGFPVVTLQNTRYWDGRNSNHQYVEGGLYLYQIETEGHLISGTVVVIK